ncbi:MAG TPA: HisA/HisF-related TIM barrel protein [Acidimicrobiales bacterium]|nr:HisA/HisF-related TIM barrel protein [Acidimicrobiales bacterium]
MTACYHVITLSCYKSFVQLLPALDLLGDDAVRLERGVYTRVVFRRPALELLGEIVASGADLVHVVDLDGARDGVARIDLLERLAAAAGATRLQFSGGLRNVDTARAALTAGATRVVVGTAAWRKADALSRFAEALGDRLVVAIDVRDGRLAVGGWRESTDVSLDEALAACVNAGVVRIHVTAIDRDGTLSGPDLALYERACGSGLAVIAAGGVRDDADLAELERVGCEAAVMGLGYLARLGLIDPEAMA